MGVNDALAPEILKKNEQWNFPFYACSSTWFGISA
jgi:hypothetical protein